MTSSSAFSPSSAFSALAAHGWDDAWAEAFAPYGAEGLVAGRVVRVDRGQCDVVTADGVLRADTAFVTRTTPCGSCTGDWVAVEPAGSPRYVRAYLPRRTAFVRSTSSKRSEGRSSRPTSTTPSSPSRSPSNWTSRVERFLALAWDPVPSPSWC